MSGLIPLAGGAAVLMLAVLVPAIRRTFVTVTVRGTSMMPTLADGDRVLVRRTRRTALGQLVVFAPTRMIAAGDPNYHIKRVVAVAGEPTPPEIRPAVTEPRVPAGHIAVRGDNPKSQDSRHYGWIPCERLLGVVVRPLSRAEHR